MRGQRPSGDYAQPQGHLSDTVSGGGISLSCWLRELTVFG